MKSIRFIFVTLITLGLQACGNVYYQVYEVGTDINKTDNALVYTDENCDIIYNLWDKSGSMDFIFTNKTDTDIYIDLTHSFYIQNGMAYDYYSDKEYTSASYSSVSSTTSLMSSYTKYGYTDTPYLWTPTTISRGEYVSSTVLAGHSTSVTTRMEKFIYVPAKASKLVRSFSISDYIYAVCGNNKFNMPSKISEKISYTSDKSPLKFRNRISYILNDEVYNVDNSFWIESVQNYKSKYLITTEIDEDCITHLRRNKQEFKISRPDMFYNDYEMEAKYAFDLVK